MKDKVTTNENLLGCLIALLSTPFLIAIRGWVLMTLWKWIIVPTFGIRTLTTWQAIGLSVVIGVFMMKLPDNDDDSVLETTIRALVYSSLTYAVALTLGWIVSYQI